MKKQYSEPKIYDAGGDLSARWYVYFQFRHPETGKLTKQTPRYEFLHQHKNVRDRREAARNLQTAISHILKNGYNPYLDEKEENLIAALSVGDNQAKEELNELRKLSVAEAIDFVLSLRKQTNPGDFSNYKSRLKQLQKYLDAKEMGSAAITDIGKRHIQEFLNEVMGRTSKANRNGVRSYLYNFFQILEDNEIVPVNFMGKIKKERVKYERNRSFSLVQEQKIHEFLEKREELFALLIYIKFISYNFVRPIEANRLTIGDIDLLGKRIYYRSKTSPVKIKIIPEILLAQLPDMSTMPTKAYFFGRSGFGQAWEANDKTRREHYGDLFKIVKEHFNLGPEYTIYSFRHTAIAKLHASLIGSGLTPEEAYGKGMLITGHESKNAYMKYLRDIDAILPDDYSKYLE